MKFSPARTLLALALVFPVLSLHAKELESLIEKGTLILSDDFDRTGEEGPGNDWSVSEKNGTGRLVDGRLVIEMAKDAGHSVSVKHDLPFDDGVVRLRFRLFDKSGLKINFNDPAANKITWAGHIARVVVQPGKITISDDKTGTYDLENRAKRKDRNLPEAEKKALETLIKSRQPTFEAPIKLKQWHELTTVFVGPRVEVFLDGVSIGFFESEGLDHEVKQNVALGVSGKVEVDKIEVWSLD